MAAIKFSRKEFEKHIKLTPEIEEKINLFGTHFEEATDEEIILEILPNRPDLFSLQTFIKSFIAFLGKETGLRKYSLNKPEQNFKVKIDSSLKEIRPYTACAIIKNLKFNDEKIKEMIDIQEKIHMTLGRNRKKIAIGIYPLEKIKLPITFKAEDPKAIKFQPLEMDREINGFQILQQHPTGREYAHLLEGKEKFPVFRDSNNEVLSLPPIINSHKTGKITETTNDIFIECSGFDFEILKKTLNILCVMFAEMKGQIYQMELDYGSKKILSPDLTPEKIKLNTENTNKLLGLELKEKDLKPLLEKMGYELKNQIVHVPAWRTDIMHEVDIIEDIAIAYGYNNFNPEIPSISTIGEISKLETMKKKLSEILTGLNILELSNYHLIKQDDKKILNIKEVIEVEDSKSEYKFLRPNLISMILKTLKENVDKEYPQRIFETGRVFSRDLKHETETGIEEKEQLCIALAENQAGFTEIKQILDYMSKMLNIPLEIKATKEEHFIEGRCGEIILKNKSIGFLGEIHPQILSDLKIKIPVVCLQLDINEIL